LFDLNRAVSYIPIIPIISKCENGIGAPLKTVERILAPFLIVAAFAPVVRAQLTPGPIINSVNPASVTAGSAEFTLIVSGTGFISNSVARVNGVNRTTVFVSKVQLTAIILASDIAAPGTLNITVFDPIVGPVGGLGQTSNTAILQVTSPTTPPNGPPAGGGPAPPGAPLPTLTSASPGMVAQEAGQLRMTLVGTNFRPGAIVIISPPVASVSSPRALVEAQDVAIESVQRVSSTVLIALASFSPQASTSLRAVDVVNADGTSTGPSLVTAVTGSGTSQPMRIELSSSLGAPLSAVTIAVTHPRNGTLVMQGDDLYGDAVLGGTGTGTVIGEWLWDGEVTEQFAVVFTGGERNLIRTEHSFPTSFLGVHTVELRIKQPNQLASQPIQVIVNPGDWQLQKLLGPAYGAGFRSDAPPFLWWAPVPGAVKYQVGFAREPYFISVEKWYDVNDNEWQVPGDIWRSLPDGQLYWTVRTIDDTDLPRKPRPMRSILKFPADALRSVSATAARTPAGNPLLQWSGLPIRTYYQITVSADADFNRPLRRYLAAEPQLDLRALRGKLNPGQMYYWKVDAVAPDGTVILQGPTQTFVAPANSQARAVQSSAFTPVAMRAESQPAFPTPQQDIASLIASRSPAPNATVTDAKPSIAIQFSSPVNPADLSLMVDDTDVTSLAQVADTSITYTPALPLPSGMHSVNLTIANAAISWNFTVQAAAAAAAPAQTSEGTSSPFQPGTDAETPPAAPAAAVAVKPQGPTPPTARKAIAEHPQPSIASQMQTQLGAVSQWASGSAPDTNAVTFGQQMLTQTAHWRLEMNGSGMLNTTFNPEVQRTSMGRVNDYVVRGAYTGAGWGVNVRFGIISPVLYTDSEFVTAATPRQGVEVTVTSAAGAFSYFANTNDVALGGGVGITFHQQIRGASWQAPLPKKWAEFRLMWLSARDIGVPTTVQFDQNGQPLQTVNPVGTAGSGDAYGALLQIHLTPSFLWSSEYAWSYDNPNLGLAGSHRVFGRAWRTGLVGSLKKAAVSVVYRNVSPNFESPANPSLTLLSNPDRRGVDSSLTTPTLAGVFTLGYTFLESNVSDPQNPEQLLHDFTETWTKPIHQKTTVALTAHEDLTQTGTVPAAVKALPPDQQKDLEPDQQDVGANLTVTRSFGKVALTAGGSRDWFRNDSVTGQNVITSSILGGVNWNTSNFFQINSNVSANWIAADKSTVGDTHSVSLYIQPTFVWQRAAFQVAPLISVNTLHTELLMGVVTADTMTGEYGGQIGWTMPGALKFSTLSMQGELTRNRDNVNNTNFRATQLLAVWTLVWNHHQGI
jgi:hypothetical protein